MAAAVTILKPDLRCRPNGRRPPVTNGENRSETPVGRRAVRSGDLGRWLSSRRLLRSRRRGGGLGYRGGVIVAATPPKDLFIKVGEDWLLSFFLSTAINPKIPSRAKEWHKFAESEGGVPFSPKALQVDFSAGVVLLKQLGVVCDRFISSLRR